jgi:hypothetical protein
MEKTTKLLEDAVEHMIADGVDAAMDWEAELEEFADMFDSPDDGPDALCVMKEVPEASRSYQEVW